MMSRKSRRKKIGGVDNKGGKINEHIALLSLVNILYCIIIILNRYFLFGSLNYSRDFHVK